METKLEIQMRMLESEMKSLKIAMKSHRHAVPAVAQHLSLLARQIADAAIEEATLPAFLSKQAS